MLSPHAGFPRFPLKELSGRAVGVKALAFAGVRQRLKSSRYNARCQGRIRIEYRYHPHFGQELPVRRSYPLQRIEVELEHSHLVVPLWMTDADSCAPLTFGREPVCSFTSLLELSSFLQSTGL